MIRKGIRPRFRFGFDRPLPGELFERRYPFRKSWVAIAVLLVMNVVFTIPAITTFRHFSDGIGDGGSLFDLVFTVFMGAWLLGWSMAPLAITTILVVLLFGRETIRIAPGVMEATVGLPLLGLSATYELDRMRNLRIEHPEKKSGKAWRGTHFEFDYGANSSGFGSDVESAELGEIESAIRMASGKPSRRGEASPDELAEEWEEKTETPVQKLVTEPVVADSPKSGLTPSVAALVVANLVPVAGTVFFGWELSDVMVLFWAESAIIGLFNIAKIAVIGRWAGLFAGLFFAAHFGGFMAVHFLFIYTIFVEGFQGDGPSGDLAEVFALFASLWPALLALALSHGYSFIANFLGRKEHLGKTVKDQMSEPYSRIIFMHLVLIFGGGLAMALGEPTIVILIVIAIKIFADIRAHLKQRESGRHASGAS